MNQIYLGVDLHARQMTVHQIEREDEGGMTRKRQIVGFDHYEEFFAAIPVGSHLCVESSTGAFQFVRRSEVRAGSVHVVNPQAMKELYCTSKKTDRVDAKKLAERLRRHIEEGDPDDGFPEIWVPDEATQELRKLLSHYDFVQQDVVATKNRLALVFRQRMIGLDDRSPKTIAKEATRPELSDEDRFTITLGLERLMLFERQKAEIRRHIERMAIMRFPSEMRTLISMSGISLFIAAAFLSEIGDVHRFASAKKLSAYLCAAPTIDASSQTIHVGGLSKRGRHRAYRLILQGLAHVISGNPRFLEFYKRKKVGKHACRVRAAMVRKTIVSLYYMLKNEELCRDVKETLYVRKLKEIDKLNATLAA